MKIVQRMEKIIIDYEHPGEKEEAFALIDKENFFILKDVKLYPYGSNTYRLIGEKPMKEEKVIKNGFMETVEMGIVFGKEILDLLMEESRVSGITAEELVKHYVWQALKKREIERRSG